MSRKRNRRNSESPVAAAEASIWGDVLKVILGEKKFNRILTAMQSGPVFDKEGRLISRPLIDEKGRVIALAVNSGHFQIPAERQSLTAAERLAIIKVQAEQVLKPEIEQRVHSKRLVEAARFAATEALECVSILEDQEGSGDAALLLQKGIQLGRAMYKIELWTELWPAFEKLHEKSENQKSRLKGNSSKSVAAKQKKADERREVCRHLAHDYVGISIRQAAICIRASIKDKRLLADLPSLRTIISDISDLFPNRTRRKPLSPQR